MQVITIGIDLAKNVFQVHGVDANDKVVFNKPLRRSQVLPFFCQTRAVSDRHGGLCVGPLLGSRAQKLGHDVRLMPAKDVKAYVKRNKNDSVDSGACCEAVRRPTVRTVPAKTPAGVAVSPAPGARRNGTTQSKTGIHRRPGRPGR
jgi:transposase